MLKEKGKENVSNARVLNPKVILYHSYSAIEYIVADDLPEEKISSSEEHSDCDLSLIHI